MRIRIRLPCERRPFCSCVEHVCHRLNAFQIEFALSDNWREHIALDASAPPGHFRDPYPAPTWTIRPSQLAALARPLPESVPRTPSPSPGPSTATLNPTQQGSGKAKVKSPSSAPGSVKVEPSGHPTSAVKSEEPGEGHSSTTYSSRRCLQNNSLSARPSTEG
jgi:hypothetical protein